MLKPPANAPATAARRRAPAATVSKSRRSRPNGSSSMKPSSSARRYVAVFASVGGEALEESFNTAPARLQDFGVVIAPRRSDEPTRALPPQSRAALHASTAQPDEESPAIPVLRRPNAGHCN